MAEGSCSRLVTTVTFLTLFSFCVSSSVPVISWWYGQSNVSPTINVLAGHSLEKNAFVSYFKPILEKSNVLLVFVQDELSIDDFTRYGKSFPFIKSSLEHNGHTVLPSVSDKDGSIVDILSSSQKSKIIEVPPETDWDSFELKSKIEDDIINIVVIKMEPLRDSNAESKETVLRRNDNTMKSIISKITSDIKSFVVIFTSENQSKDITNILNGEQLKNEHSLNSRHLLGVSSPVQAKIFQTKCVLMFLRGLQFGLTSAPNMTELLDVSDNETVAGDCNMEQNTMVIKMNDKKGPIQKDFKLTVLLKKDNKTEWVCSKIKAEGKITNDSSTIDVDADFDCGNDQIPWVSNSYNTIVSPLQYSFACHSMAFFSPNKTYALKFNGLQLQPFQNFGTNGTKVEFGGAYNCEGFFTLAILTGLFIGALLITSLFLGMMMMMNIQTQGRFDDPKGKTISVAAQE